MENGPRAQNQIRTKDKKQRRESHKALVLLVLVLIFLVGLAMGWWADCINVIIRAT